MANTTKKYVSLEKLGLYDEKIKKVITDADAVALQSAKDYADSLATNYDAAGSAATALQEAKNYADGKDAAIQAAQKAGDDAMTAAGVADGKAVQAQNEVDALETYVGTFTPSEGVDTVVKYIDAKTANIASDATVNALAERVTQAEKDIDAIEADYLKAVDKTELAEDIQEVATAVETEKSRAEGIEAGFETRIKALEDDHLVAADKEELQGNIDTLTGVVETLRDGVDAEKVDGIKDLIKYVEDHGPEVTGMKEDIAKNASDIEGVTGRMTTAEGKITDLEAASATHALKTEVEAVSGALNEYKEAHKDDFTNAQIEAAIKVVADDVAALNETYATDTEVSDAIAAEVERANGAYAVKGLEKTVSDHVADTVAHVTADDKALWNAALQASDIATGAANGTIAVKGADVAVKGLGSAAFTDASAYDVAGAASTVQGKLDEEILRAKAAEEANAAAIALFVECSEEDINGMFA